MANLKGYLKKGSDNLYPDLSPYCKIDYYDEGSGITQADFNNLNLTEGLYMLQVSGRTNTGNDIRLYIDNDLVDSNYVSSYSIKTGAGAETGGEAMSRPFLLTMTDGSYTFWGTLSITKSTWPIIGGIVTANNWSGAYPQTCHGNIAYMKYVSVINRLTFKFTNPSLRQIQIKLYKLA